MVNVRYRATPYWPIPQYTYAPPTLAGTRRRRLGSAETNKPWWGMLVPFGVGLVIATGAIAYLEISQGRRVFR